MNNCSYLSQFLNYLYFIYQVIKLWWWDPEKKAFKRLLAPQKRQIINGCVTEKTKFFFNKMHSMCSTWLSQEIKLHNIKKKQHAAKEGICRWKKDVTPVLCVKMLRIECCHVLVLERHQDKEIVWPNQTNAFIRVMLKEHRLKIITSCITDFKVLNAQKDRISGL